MINILSSDLLLEITYNLDIIYDVNNLMAICKDINQLYTNDFYLEWGRNKYTKNFWDIAEKRSRGIIKPYISMKIELMRIENFQIYLSKKNLQRWENKDFFKYWDSLERAYNRKLINQDNSQSVLNTECDS